ncbi:sugar transporter [Pestalotiopsis sp. NC0098]|nr:sugar transporter [Pestalotiopsis sp. NC0098]
MAITAPASTEADTAYGPTGYKGLLRAPPIVIVMSLLASIGGILFGYDQGVISGVLVMNSFVKTFPELATDTTLKGWAVSVLTLGAMFGAFANGPIADHLSRRWSIALASVVFIIGSAIQAGAVNIAMIFVGRACAGYAIGMLSMVVPLYLSELAPSNLRGALVSLQQLGITLGIMVSFWIDYGTAYIGGTGDGQSEAAWRLPLALQCLPALILGISTLVLPYSPRWLMLKDREEEAVIVLTRIRRVPADDWRLQREILEIKAASVFDNETVAERYSGVSKLRVMISQYTELFVERHLNRRLLIACLLQVIQQFTGINAIIYYAPTIFQSIGLSGNSVDLLATGVVGIIDFVSTIPAIMFLDRWGRKGILLSGAVGMGVCQLLVGTLYAIYENSWDDHKGAGWAAAVFIWLYIASFAYSIGCVNWIMPSELFPPANRAKAVGVAIGTNWLSNFIVGLITPRMLASISFGTFFFFLAFCVILFIWVYFFVPETRGVRIEEMDNLFGGSQGEADVQRLKAVRHRLGLDTSREVEEKASQVHEEHVNKAI